MELIAIFYKQLTGDVNNERCRFQHCFEYFENVTYFSIELNIIFEDKSEKIYRKLQGINSEFPKGGNRRPTLAMTFFPKSGGFLATQSQNIMQKWRTCDFTSFGIAIYMKLENINN